MLNKKDYYFIFNILFIKFIYLWKQSDDERESKKRDYKHSNYHKDKDYSDKKIKSEKQKYSSWFTKKIR